MMIKTKTVTFALALAMGLWIAAPYVAFAEEGEEPKLDVGDDAPPLSLTDWIKGEPVAIGESEDDYILVIEFWATWCGPCRASIPHLTDLQRAFKDRNVTVLAITMEEVDHVAEFVEDEGDNMQYTVAIDGDRKTWAAYMDASGARGIPHVFVVDADGVIAWQGHPREPELENLLDEMAPKPEDLEA